MQDEEGTLFPRLAGALIAQEVPPRVALELSQVSFCDSEGLNAFVVDLSG